MRMQVSLVGAVSPSPNLAARSITGTTWPRRLMMPRTERGVDGTRVVSSYCRISFTFRIPTAYSVSRSEKERYCTRTASSFAPMASPFLECR